MDDKSEMLSRVRDVAKKKLLFLPHALRQMSRPDRMITTSEVRSVIERGEVVENYPDDPRGESCLVLGHGESRRSIHIVCAPREDYLAIITAYLPDEDEWTDNFTVRKNP